MHTISTIPKQSVPLVDQFSSNLRVLALLFANRLNPRTLRDFWPGTRKSGTSTSSLALSVSFFLISGTLFPQNLSAAPTPGFVQGNYLDSGSGARSESVAYPATNHREIST